MAAAAAAAGEGRKHERRRRRKPTTAVTTAAPPSAPPMMAPRGGDASAADDEEGGGADDASDVAFTVGIGAGVRPSAGLGDGGVYLTTTVVPHNEPLDDDESQRIAGAATVAPENTALAAVVARLWASAFVVDCDSNWPARAMTTVKDVVPVGCRARPLSAARRRAVTGKICAPSALKIATTVTTTDEEVESPCAAAAEFSCVVRAAASSAG